MSKIKLITLAAGISLAAMSLNSGVAMAADGATLYYTKTYQNQTCATCHGIDAKTPLIPFYPKLAGQNKEYAIQQMKDIKSGKRNNGLSAVMKPIMDSVNDAEIVAIAEWLASLSGDEAGNIDAKGAGLYQTKTCFVCHGADAKTPLKPFYSKIAGQNKAYVLQQMKDIKSGARHNGLSVVMKGIMNIVNDTEMEIIAGWLAGQ